MLNGTATVGGGNGGQGAAGGPSIVLGGNGGNGGGGGTGFEFTVGGALTNAAVITGGTGGDGGSGGTSSGSGFGGSGGRGGNGGNGLNFGGVSSLTNNAGGSITGGSGGASGTGGNASARGGTGGVGGNGGNGLLFTAGGSVNNAGSITGGNGTAGGSGGTGSSANGASGTAGSGGAGIAGANLTISNSGTISGGLGGDGVTRGNAITFTGGTNVLNLNPGGTQGILTGQVSLSGTLTFNQSNAVALSNVIAGTGSIFQAGSGTLTFSGANTYSGSTTVNVAATLIGGAANTFSAGSATTVIGMLDLGGFAQTINAVFLANGTIGNGTLTGAINSAGGTIDWLAGSASLTTTSGTTVVTGINSYTGATTVNGGVLDVVGTLTDPTVNAGGTLMGTGTVATTQVNAGGIFAPGDGTAGTSMTIAGNLAFQSGAVYLVQVNPAVASFATVTGTALLGGATVNAVFANGSYISKTYTILTASGGVSGSFGGLVSTNLPANFTTGLSYDANNAYLKLALNYTPAPSGPDFGKGLNRNQQAVANALVSSFNANGGIPLGYGALNAAGLTQAAGELGASSQQATFTAMNQLMGMLTDPFLPRSSAGGWSPGASGFAEDGEASAYAAARKPTEVFAMIAKAPPAPSLHRWSVWAQGFGGSQSTDGHAAIGSDNTTAQVFGTAVGADYSVSAHMLAGFALAGGGTTFSINGLGSGRSDLFQAGAYLRHGNGPVYLSAALAYGWQDITTDRSVALAGVDRLRAQFNANAWSGRMEGGYRFVVPGGLGVTPYAAAQFTTFAVPAYAEQVISGGSTFALRYGAHSPTDTRTELGLRTDKLFALDDAVLTLRGRAAWAHDFDPERSTAATFQALPGATFVVAGAAQASDAALTTAAAELTWRNGWSAAATFEGEFSAVTRAYAGNGAVRYAW